MCKQLIPGHFSPPTQPGNEASIIWVSPGKLTGCMVPSLHQHDHHLNIYTNMNVFIGTILTSCCKVFAIRWKCQYINSTLEGVMINRVSNDRNFSATSLSDQISTVHSLLHLVSCQYSHTLPIENVPEPHTAVTWPRSNVVTIWMELATLHKNNMHLLNSNKHNTILVGVALLIGINLWSKETK